MSRAVSAALGGIVALGLLAGCDAEKRDIEPESPYVEPTSPEAVLDNLKVAWIAEDRDAVRGLFTEDYTFWFSPEDVGDPNEPTPPSWALTDELESFDGLSTDETVQRVAVDFRKGDLIPSDEFEGWMKMYVTEVDLRVETRQASGEQITWLVPSGRELFHFRTAGTTSAGQPLWKICRWEDEPTDSGKRGSRVVEKSWGSIKALYY